MELILDAKEEEFDRVLSIHNKDSEEIRKAKGTRSVTM